jgi:site-specific DNA-methyltransferase (adenine-specific)
LYQLLTKLSSLAPIQVCRLAMASNPGQIVIDPFGGGTTFYTAEKLHRYWLGTEIGDVQQAVKRLTDLANGKIEEWESAKGKTKALRISC